MQTDSHAHYGGEPGGTMTVGFCDGNRITAWVGEWFPDVG